MGEGYEKLLDLRDFTPQESEVSWAGAESLVAEPTGSWGLRLRCGTGQEQRTGPCDPVQSPRPGGPRLELGHPDIRVQALPGPAPPPLSFSSLSATCPSSPGFNPSLPKAGAVCGNQVSALHTFSRSNPGHHPNPSDPALHPSISLHVNLHLCPSPQSNPSPVQLQTGPIMAKDFQDIQQLSSEENDYPLQRGPPPAQLLPQRLCSTVRFSLLALGFNILLLVVICVVGSQSARLQAELRTLEEAFRNFSSSTLMEIYALGTHGGSVGDKITSLGAKLEKQKQDLKAGQRASRDHDSLLLHLKHFPMDLRFLTCQMELLHSNGSQRTCCPVNWVEHQASCYWFSHSGKAWAEAEKYCQLENAHLVVINSWEEQKFIAQHTNPFDTWIGLTDSDGSWKWVDGTDYSHSYKNWAATQPDDWHGHEPGESEDCAEIRPDGRWNDDFCLQVHRWVCEKKRNITSEVA
ncbi:asialoglycoprotein receptor 2 isoform X4 [Callithrix jacchus]